MVMIEKTSQGTTSHNSSSMHFRVFKDYLGLANLVLPGVKEFGGLLHDENLETDDFLFSGTLDRKRVDSFSGSWSDSSLDTRSETGSSASTDFDTLSADFPPLSRGAISPSNIIGESRTSFEPLFSNRKTPFNDRLVGTVEKSRSRHASKASVCVFCRNNGESMEFYSSHVLKDNEGNTTCPILRAYTCPLCKANGDNSHTIKYCPKYTPKHKIEKVISMI